MKLFALFITFFAATSVSALEQYPFDQSQNWETSIDVYSDTAMGCSTQTENSDREMFRIAIMPDASVTLFMAISNYYPPDRYTADVLVDIDYQRWSLDNTSVTHTGDLAIFAFQFADGEIALDFITDIRKSNAFALKDVAGNNTVSAWSLRGSTDATTQMFLCFGKVMNSVNG